jgi:hypothetical protein
MRRVWFAVPVVVLLLLATSAWAVVVSSGLPGAPLDTNLVGNCPWEYIGGPSPSLNYDVAIHGMPWEYQYGLNTWDTTLSMPSFGLDLVTPPWDYPPGTDMGNLIWVAVPDDITGGGGGGGIWWPVPLAPGMSTLPIVGTVGGVPITWVVTYAGDGRSVTWLATSGGGLPSAVVGPGGPGLVPWDGFQIASTVPPATIHANAFGADGPVPGPAPEPGAMALLALGLPGVAFGLVRRKRSK